MLVTLVLLMFALSCTPLWARDVEITVQDADVGAPLEGALIRSDGGEYTADEHGVCIVPVPDEAPMVITITYPGYEALRVLIPLRETVVIAALRLAGILENRELVLEAAGPGADAVAPGRGVAIAGGELARTAEMGIVEDVMSSLKLLPGVGYTGFFDAMPSIRGGDPQDLIAVLNGFYIENPYHWGGAYSIFDPRMTERAQLSHGVFSSRFGNTVSGLLELTSKRPSSEVVTMDLGVSTSAVDLNLSLPLRGKGGLMVMGKVSYWQPFIEAAHLFMPISRNVKQAPWITSGGLSANYRFTPNLEWTLSGFIGNDGIGFAHKNQLEEVAISGTSSLSHFFDNTIGFLITGLQMHPLNTMVVKTSLGAGFTQTNVNIDMKDTLSIRYTQDFLDIYGDSLMDPSTGEPKTSYQIDQDAYHHETKRTIHYQGGADLDWELGKGFLIAAGVQELYSQWGFNQHDYEPYDNGQLVNSPENPLMALDFTADVHNDAFSSAAYTLLEYASANRVFGTELGVRLDHSYLIGDDFSIQTIPVLNPRLNLDWRILQNRGPLEALNLTLGTGLFSSIDESLHYLEKRHGVADFDLKPTRSWTSLAGTSLEFFPGLRLNIEGYFKYVFDRTYTSLDVQAQGADLVYRFDGEGRIWGIDVLLQKTESRYWDGWISYSFTHARYRDPQGVVSNKTIIGNEVVGTGWYYPAFHRFHTVNLVVTIKPLRQFHIAARLGFTSGKPKKEQGPITSTLVQTEDGQLIEQFMRTETYSDRERTTFSLPLDLKFSWYRFDPKGRVRSEIYFSVENILALFLPSIKSTVVNRYTGAEEEAGGMAVMTQLAMPLPSFGIKWSY
ncbi:MAG: TonB-dependent receptor plug domain-containing protein [Treponema sp.]|nr:TonB-dependent receptor plug domain-containing protein [Treponema sp.]